MQAPTQPANPRSLKVQPLHILYVFLGELVGGFDPAFDDRRTPDRRVDFPDQGGAEEDEVPPLDGLNHDVLTGPGRVLPILQR